MIVVNGLKKKTKLAHHVTVRSHILRSIGDRENDAYKYSKEWELLGKAFLLI